MPREPRIYRGPCFLWDMLFSVRTAAGNLSRSKRRTLLSILGVFLGALLLTTVVHVLGGIARGIEEKAVRLGVGIITVTPERPLFSRESDGIRSFSRNERGVGAGKDAAASLLLAGTIASAATLKLSDLAAILREFPAVAKGVPFVLQKGQVFYGATSSTCQLFGITADFPESRSYTVAAGRFFTPEEERERAPVCVLGNALASRLFGKLENAVGRRIRIEYSPLLVLGIFPPIGADSGDTNLDEVVFFPLSTLMNRLSFRDHVDGFFLQLTGRDDFAPVKAGLEAMLRNLHGISEGEAHDFSLSRAEKVDDMVANAYGLMTILGFIGACISFGIGSLGIFSVMTLMVHSRRVEIGIRRAIGTPARIIMQQFLCEAGLMAGAGGMLGAMAGLALVFVLSSAGLVQGYYNFAVAGGVVLVALACGLLAGGYPAWKASRTEILAALRSNQ